MAQELGPDTRRRISRYCREIARTHRLAPAARRVLEQRMHDKILALLHGEEKLDEADAFALARERFGDPALLQDLLGEVHTPDSFAMLARRVLALILAFQAAGVALDLTLGALTWLVRCFEPDFIPGNALGAHLGSAGLFDWYILGISILQLALITLLLRHWRAALRAGNQPWLVRWPLRRMLAWVTVLILLAPFTAQIPKLLLSTSDAVRPDIGNLRFLLHNSDRIFTITQTIEKLRGVALAILFFWWLGLTVPRRRAQFSPFLSKISMAGTWFFTWKCLARLPGMIIRLDVYPGSRYAAEHLTGHYFRFNDCFFKWSPLELSSIVFMIVFLAFAFPMIWIFGKGLPKVK